MKRIFRSSDFTPDPRRDVDEELRSHLELKVEDLMAGGLSEAEAWAEARRATGAPGVEAGGGTGEGGAEQEEAKGSPDWERNRAKAAAFTRSRLRHRSVTDRFDTLAQDVRYAFRRMARSPGFTTIAILSLAIGIGANTAVFSVVNAFLIRKAPYRAPEELVRIYTSHPRRSPYLSTSYPDFLSIGEMGGVFAQVGASEALMAVARLGDEPRRVLVEAVSAGLLPMLGVEPVLGRGFLPEEDANPGEHAVAILGHGFWTETFGADPGVLGQALTLSGHPYTVVGVLPEGFNSTTFAGLRIDLMVPLAMAAATAGGSQGMYLDRGNSRLSLEARLAPGIRVEEARTRLDVLAAQLQEAYPETNRERSFRVIPSNRVAISPELDQGMRFTAAFLLVVVGLVLLLACTNLASFLLARGVERQKEVATRLALGAGRRRLIRQILTETLLLGLMGGVAGVWLAQATLAVLTAVQPPIPVSVSLDLGLDRTVLLFTLGVSALAGVLFGMAPALQSTRPEVARALKEGGGSGEPRRFTLQTGLVALQVAVSMILLLGGGLFLRSLLAVQSMDPGFSTEEAGIAWLDLSASQIPPREQNALRVDLEDRLRAQPGIHTVASGSRLPLSLGNDFRGFRIPGVDLPPGQKGHRIDLAQVAPGYFQALGIPLLAGRDFHQDDRTGAPEVVVVNQAMATRFWPGEDPLGKEIFRDTDDRPLTVVGVVRDAKVSTMGEAPRPVVYFSMAQVPPGNLQVLVRGRLSPGELVATLRRVLREAYPEVLVMEVKTMTEHLSVRLFGTRAAAVLLGTFGALALLLSSLGLYGVVSFSVSRRVREVGIRMSLGARRRDVVGNILRRSMAGVAAGGLAGLGLAFFLARLIRVLLVGVSPLDPLTWAAIPLLLGSVALLAAYLPARRSTRVNPVEALRSE